MLGYIRWVPTFPTLRRKFLKSKVPEAVTFVPDIMGGPTSAKLTGMEGFEAPKLDC